MRSPILALSCLLLTGCGKPAETPAEAVLGAPVLVPMQARERLLHDLEVEQQKARDRAGTLDEVIGRDR